MTTAWSQFPAPVNVGATDILVGLAGGTTNARFNANSLLRAAQNLADVASAVAAFDNISPLTTNGDLLYFNGTHNVRLAAGTLNQVMASVGTPPVPTWINNPALLIANNLSDVADIPTTLNNIGLGQGNSPQFNSLTLSGSLVSSTHNAITAHAGGGQGSATALDKQFNRVTTVATAGDSVKLPAAVFGKMVAVVNAAASNAMDCFPSTGDAINALAANTALSIAANKTVLFICVVNGTWNSIVTA